MEFDSDGSHEGALLKVLLTEVWAGATEEPGAGHFLPWEERRKLSLSWSWVEGVSHGSWAMVQDMSPKQGEIPQPLSPLLAPSLAGVSQAVG